MRLQRRCGQTAWKQLQRLLARLTEPSPAYTSPACGQRSHPIDVPIPMPLGYLESALSTPTDGCMPLPLLQFKWPGSH